MENQSWFFSRLIMQRWHHIFFLLRFQRPTVLNRLLFPQPSHSLEQITRLLKTKLSYCLVIPSPSSTPHPKRKKKRMKQRENKKNKSPMSSDYSVVPSMLCIEEVCEQSDWQWTIPQSCNILMDIVLIISMYLPFPFFAVSSCSLIQRSL